MSRMCPNHHVVVVRLSDYDFSHTFFFILYTHKSPLSALSSNSSFRRHFFNTLSSIFFFFSHFSAPYLVKIFSSPHTSHCWWVLSTFFLLQLLRIEVKLELTFCSVFRSPVRISLALSPKSDFSVGGNQERWWRSVELYFILCWRKPFSGLCQAAWTRIHYSSERMRELAWISAGHDTGCFFELFSTLNFSLRLMKFQCSFCKQRNFLSLSYTLFFLLAFYRLFFFFT